MNDAGQTICLCMIVKNEASVITRCLDSVRDLIDTWVIVDTGSKDGTQDRIVEHMLGTPGKLYERPWVNFAHNRSESLVLARRLADYVLIIDADEVLELEPGFSMPSLEADAYQFRMRSGPITYFKTQLVRDAMDWYFEGVLHEHIFCGRPFSQERLAGLRTLRFADGARARDPLTYRRDALLLESAVLQEPDNARHMFYLAQSYADAGEFAVAIDRYKRRIAMGGWAEEVWCSLYRIAQLMQRMEAPWPEVLDAYLSAFAFRRDRAEPLFHAGYYYQARKEFGVSHLFFSQAMQVPFPEADVLFVDRSIYDLLLPLEYSVACFYVGRHREAIETSNRLLRNPELTVEMRGQIARNREYSLEACYPRRTHAGVGRDSILVYIDLRGGANELSRSVESLLQQVNATFRVILDTGGICGCSLRGLPLDDKRFMVQESGPTASWANRLKMAARGTGPEEIILLMSGKEWLVDPQSLQHVADHFADYQCMLMQAPYRREDGALVDVAPFASEDDLRMRSDKEQSSVLAFRSALLQEEELPEDAAASLLLRRSRFERVRFTERPILVRTSPS